MCIVGVNCFGYDSRFGMTSIFDRRPAGPTIHTQANERIKAGKTVVTKTRVHRSSFETKRPLCINCKGAVKTFPKTYNTKHSTPP